MQKLLRKLNLWFERLLLLVLVGVFLIAAWCVYDSWYVYSHTLDESILRYKPGAVTASGEEPQLTEDMVAWLTIEDTPIDYPVMQSGDNLRYLNTDPFGNYSLGGSIFLDSRNDPDFTDDYSLIYGHHMEYGKMFGALDAFLQEDYLHSHQSGTLLIGKQGERSCRLHIFAALQESASTQAVFDPGQGGIHTYLRSVPDMKISVPQGRLLALSTCTGADSDKRTIVFAYIEE